MQSNIISFILRIDFLILSLLFFVNPVDASVTLLGTRVIYPAEMKSVDVQLKNKDNIPYVIQTWFDDGNPNSKPEDITATPFISTPPVFRIQPQSGQVVRIIIKDKNSLPQDRESVFWFNVLQIPPSIMDDISSKNSMMIMLRNRLKIFYRPVAIGRPDNIFKGLAVKQVFDSRNGIGLEINNSQPWNVSLVNLSLKTTGKVFRSQGEMLAPFSRKTFWFKNSKNISKSAGAATLTVINDQGATINESYRVNAQ